MNVRRRLVEVPGEPSKVASRAAVRLAIEGGEIEPLSATEFIWRPAEAERKLFRCPKQVRVTALEGDQPGFTSVVIEWRDVGGLPWLPWLTGGMIALGLAAMAILPGLPFWQMLGGLAPVLVAFLAPKLMDSRSLPRIIGACSVGTTPTMSAIPDVERWLTLDEPEREAALVELRQVMADMVAGDPNTYRGEDRRSSTEILGWPLWHIATGRDPLTGKARWARGWYARGQCAEGLVAVGQLSHGWFAIGQCAWGLVALGQAAFGVISGVGQLALGALYGLGQLAVGLVSAGMAAFGLFVAAPWAHVSDLTIWLLSALGIVTAAVWAGVFAVSTGWLRGNEQQELTRRLAERGYVEPVADEHSLSPAERLTGDEAERGISLAEGSEQTVSE
ncbi:MAG: hypothetical protein HYU66_11820 [Armatimonadetes bacterium]|nr:hypothetical protein [Armatimonadota bacterium]